MLDVFMYGSVNRISPEAPVPIFRFAYNNEMPGGAGNVAANLASLGCQTTCIGLVGDDPAAQKLTHMLEERGCKSILLQLKNHLTTVKTRMIASHNHLLRTDHEIPSPDLSLVIRQFQEIIEQEVAAADIVLLSDYAKGFLTDETTQIVIDIARRYEKPVIVDPKGVNYAKYNGAMLIKPNLKEFQEVTGMTFNPQSDHFHADIARGAKKLFDQYHISNLVVTLSEHGALHVSSKEPSKVTQIPTEAREVFDVSGAGDTTFATLGAALGTGAEMGQALILANVASGIVVGKLGTACVTTEEICEHLGQKNGQWMMKNIVSSNKIASILAPLRRQNKTVGFTNGCFDCMHLGHLNSFRQARAECDVLVVGVNSDKSVKSYKGPDRPIQNELTRATLVASLKYVDYVVVFDETTAECLIDIIRPDVVAKEGYAIERWPEARQVIAYGGRAVVLERTEGYSTTEIIAKVRKAA
ncbi:MAG: bifunctional heptose 7-phosphate kinase/heptose 1-phosphate adenyltransferase [Planctomycetaceae bacterium]|nr:bifunctional heptose 7-phosphate kinase/heptose 1-phosphate adenyltransferase [Planctomycetaceae bacterium]